MDEKDQFDGLNGIAVDFENSSDIDWHFKGGGSASAEGNA